MSALNDFRPVILVRGFDPLGDINQSTYYGFNDGTIYPQKLGDDYIYEGMLLKFLKTHFLYPSTDDQGNRMIGGPIFYQDATNALRYLPYQPSIHYPPPAPSCISDLQTSLLNDVLPTKEQENWLSGPVVLEPSVAKRFKGVKDTVWVYRYYDFKYRDVAFYAEQLRRVVEMVETIVGEPGVNLICHSMGGVVARYLIQRLYANRAEAETHINKWVTLGTPHRGIEFDVFPDLNLWELQVFNREEMQNKYFPSDTGSPLEDISEWYDPARILCIVGTNWQTYAVKSATALNQFASWLQGQDQNKSDGLVKQECATLKSAHLAYVYKCHGGADSLITSREAFELATRFFFGDVYATVKVTRAAINPSRAAGHQALGGLLTFQPQFYWGFSVKPRRLDFFLNKRDAESENCFGPFDKAELTAEDFVYDPFDARRNGTIFEGFFNSALTPADRDDLVFRFDTYVGERDPNLLGHSDTIIVNQQSYFQARPLPDNPDGTAADPPLELIFYPKSIDPASAIRCTHKGPQGIFTLMLDFGDLHPDIALELEIVIS